MKGQNMKVGDFLKIKKNATMRAGEHIGEVGRVDRVWRNQIENKFYGCTLILRDGSYVQCYAHEVKKGD